MSAAMSTPGFVSFGSMPYDDVYLEDGSSEGEEDQHVTTDTRRPLMSPRKRPKVALRQPQSAVGVYPLIKKRLLKWFYVIIALLFISLLVFVLLRITYDAEKQFDGQADTTIHDPGGATSSPKHQNVEIPHTDLNEKVFPCLDFDVEDVWVQNFPKLITETAFRLVDVNQDGVLDVIMGFSTGITSYFGDQFLLCDIYFNGTRPCFGGVMAVDGITGTELWRRYIDNEIFAVNCNVDIDQDGVKDCLGGGRAGAFVLVSGRTGKLIWKFQSEELLVSISNFYTAQFIHDVDGDGIKDVLNIHGGDPLREPGQETTHFGLLIILSGATGHVITSMEVPDKRESYYSPQIYYQHGGREMVLFGTGGETRGGSLWVIAMADLLNADNSKATSIYTDEYKGIMTPPVLADITGDGVVDVVMAMFNSTTVAIDGQSYKQLWNYTMEESETYSTPAAAYYNDDDIPDFMISYSHGPGYPVYYYEQVTILDGRTGKPILTPPLRTAGSSQVSPLTISMEGYGNDFYLYFILDCIGHEGESNKFSFSKGDANKGIGVKSRSDFCQQRFNTKSFSQLSLLNQHMKPPGEQVYNSLDRVSDEYRYTVNSSLLAKAYLAGHPHVLETVKEVIINNPDGHHQAHDTGSDHSQERGDQDVTGGVHFDDGVGMDPEFQKRPSEEWEDDDSLDPQANPDVKSAPRLGFDDEGEMPFIDFPINSQPVDNQPHQLDPQDADPNPFHPEDVDPLDTYPQGKYPQDVDPFLYSPSKKYPQDVDPLDTYPQGKYPQDVDPFLYLPSKKYPQDVDPLDTYPHGKNPQDADPLPHSPKKYQQDVDPLDTYPHGNNPQDVDPLPHSPKKYPQDMDPLDTYPHGNNPQDVDPLPHPKKYPQDVDLLDNYPQGKYPQDVDPLPHSPKKYPQDVDLLDNYPHGKYPQDVDPLPYSPSEKYPQDVDPFDTYPQENPQAVDPLNSYPQKQNQPDPGDEDESQMLDKLINKLLEDKEIGDLVDQVDKTRGYPDGKSDPPLSDPRDLWSENRQHEAPARNSYPDRRYDTQGDGPGGDWFNSRYQDTQSPTYGNMQDGGYGKTDPEEARNWLKRVYNPHRSRFSDPAKPYYRTKRGTGQSQSTKSQEKSSKTSDMKSFRNKPNHLPVEYINNELFMKLQDRDTELREPIEKWLEKRLSPGSEPANQEEGSKRQDEQGTNHRSRYKRHQGPHDAGGIQRLISTGTLVPVLASSGASADHSIDLIFATYWFYPADTQIVLPEQEQCIKDWMDKESQRLEPDNVFYGLDHDAYEHMASDKCTQGSTAQQRRNLIANMQPLDIYPFNIHTGELTVYRLRLTCRCAKTSKNERCAKVLPYQSQQWGGYMGTYGNGHFPPRN